LLPFIQSSDAAPKKLFVINLQPNSFASTEVLERVSRVVGKKTNFLHSANSLIYDS
jgi:hypothetical protein